jgi:hypothetical protein
MKNAGYWAVFFVLCYLIGAAMTVGLIYVVVHFIVKYW